MTRSSKVAFPLYFNHFWHFINYFIFSFQYSTPHQVPTILQAYFTNKNFFVLQCFSALVFGEPFYIFLPVNHLFDLHEKRKFFKLKSFFSQSSCDNVRDSITLWGRSAWWSDPESSDSICHPESDPTKELGPVRQPANHSSQSHSEVWNRGKSVYGLNVLSRQWNHFRIIPKTREGLLLRQPVSAIQWVWMLHAYIFYTHGFKN